MEGSKYFITPCNSGFFNRPYSSSSSPESASRSSSNSLPEFQFGYRAAKEKGSSHPPPGRAEVMDVDVKDITRWIVFYPIYINSKKTLAEGRRINASKACENPTCTEIYDCCAHLKLPCVIEREKAYPRDFMQRGRVRVLLKRDDGGLRNPAISTRKQLMHQVAELVPRHPGRTKKPEPAASSKSGASTSTAGTSKSGKGGRKKR